MFDLIIRTTTSTFLEFFFVESSPPSVVVFKSLADHFLKLIDKAIFRHEALVTYLLLEMLMVDMPSASVSQRCEWKFSTYTPLM